MNTFSRYIFEKLSSKVAASENAIKARTCYENNKLPKAVNYNRSY